MLYARHWAEADGSPAEEARARIIELYGAEAADAIDLALRVIRIGNLMGNTWDGLLYRVPLGRWGTSEA